ncbi:hypothetical protein M422DRAFT_783899 [Sphaerobolus stellatus SS14]|uniref:C2H2-type domain-containing protein n=1 Tax=Sphaerobolus stellatus (strain SS14) TaxID=990650 RepID=A0A0C9U8F5_SPHS4|nr:hypothetical protein M422DRAFT_783899 [Sphaerobolus stellatus SS14]
MISRINNRMAGPSAFYHPNRSSFGTYPPSSISDAEPFMRNDSCTHHSSAIPIYTPDDHGRDRGLQLLPEARSSIEVEGSEETAVLRTPSGSSLHEIECQSQTEDSNTIQVAAPFSPCTEAPQHIWRQESAITPSKALNRYVTDVFSGGVLSWFCMWNGCRHPVGFAQKSQVITHIRSVHLREKPFICLTCNTRFGRKQEANRHTNAMNRGKQFKCRICEKAFSRKHYRDSHEDRCFSDAPQSRHHLTSYLYISPGMQFKHYEYRGEGEPPYNPGAQPPSNYTGSAPSRSSLLDLKELVWTDAGDLRRLLGSYPHPASHGAPISSPTSYQPGTTESVYLRDPSRYHGHSMGSPPDYRQGQHHLPDPQGPSHRSQSLPMPGSSTWNLTVEGPSSAPLRQPVDSPTAQVHEWTESKNTTLPKAIEPLIIEVPDRSGKRFFCGWIGCNHFGGFVRKAQLVTHIRSVHLCEKPFICKACDASFTRRQDAVRHVETMNSGKQYKCHYCEEGFARKDYRDRHSDRCKFR